MKVNKDDLQKALEIVKSGLANNEIIEQSTSFAFLGDRVVTYNDSISISHPIKGLDLEGAIRAEELYEFLKRLKKEEIEMTVGENEIKLKCGRAKAGLTLQSEIVLPLQQVNESKDWVDLPEEFESDLDFVKDSCGKDMSRRVLTCVHVSGNMMEASDSFQIMRVYTEQEYPFNSLIPSENVPEIIKIHPSQISQSDGWLHFRNGQGTEISCRVLNDSFPDTAAHMQVKGEKVIFPKKMEEILERVMVFTKQNYALDEEMEVKLAKGKLMVHGKNEYGWFKETARARYSGEPVSFWITPYLLKNILGRSNTCILGSEKIRFEGEGWEYIATLKGAR